MSRSQTPEGNEFCIIEPVRTGLPAADSGESTRRRFTEVGYFWSEALGWPLVRDQDRRPRSALPRGGPASLGRCVDDAETGNIDRISTSLTHRR